MLCIAGTVLCECEQCGHQDDIGTFLQDKNNVHCPQCSFRKFSQVINNTVDVQTQFISSDKTDNSNAAQSYVPNSSNDFESQCKPDRNPKEAEDKIKYTNENVTDISYSANKDVSQLSYSANEDVIASYSNDDVTKMSFTHEEKYTRTNLDQINNEKYQSSLEPSHNGFATDASQMNYEDQTEERNSHAYQITQSNDRSKSNTGCSLNFKFTKDYPASSNNYEKKAKDSNYSANSSNHSVGKQSRDSKGKSHQCDVCARVFNHKGHLRRHMLVHDKSIKQFLCHECGRGFNQKSSLHTHWTSIHCTGKNTYTYARTKEKMESKVIIRIQMSLFHQSSTSL